MGGEFAAPSLKVRNSSEVDPGFHGMGGEFAAPSLKEVDLDAITKILQGMGGEFAAPSLKGDDLPGGYRHTPGVWAANLPPPH